MVKTTKKAVTSHQVTPTVTKPNLKLISEGQKETTEKTPFEIVEQPKKIVLTLEQTLKIVEDLHLKKRQKESLERHLRLLDTFEIEQVDEDLNLKNSYGRCKIEITDDSRNGWNLRHPVIITEVVAFIKAKFYEKLAEIEAEIILPI